MGGRIFSFSHASLCQSILIYPSIIGMVNREERHGLRMLFSRLLFISESCGANYEMPFSTRNAQCSLLISAELCSFILGVCDPHETSSTSTLNASKILFLSVFECPVALTMG